MVLSSGGELALLDGVHSEAVVPVATAHQQLVVGGEEEEERGHRQVLGKGAGHKLPL